MYKKYISYYIFPKYLWSNKQNNETLRVSNHAMRGNRKITKFIIKINNSKVKYLKPGWLLMVFHR